MSNLTGGATYLEDWFADVLGPTSAPAQAPAACAPRADQQDLLTIARPAAHPPGTATRHVATTPADFSCHGSAVDFPCLASMPDSPGSSVSTTDLALPFDGMGSTDEGLACLCARNPEADVEMLAFFLNESGGDIGKAEAAFRDSYGAERGATAPSTPPPAPTSFGAYMAVGSPPPLSLPLPIPLAGSGLPPSPTTIADSPSKDGWTQGLLPAEAEDSAIMGGSSPPSPITTPSGPAPQASAGYTYASDSGSDSDSYCSSKMLAAQLQVLELREEDSDSAMGGWGWEEGTSAGAAGSPAPQPGVPAPRMPRRCKQAEEAARQAASQAFVASRQQIRALKGGADTCRQQAINMRRMNRPQEAFQLERQAKQLYAEARAAKVASSREMYEMTNKGNVLNMPPINLHNLTVGDALSKVQEAVAKGQPLVGLYSAVNVPFVTGRGAHSQDGVAKIRPEVEDWLAFAGIPYRVENAGGQLVAMLGDAYA